MYTPLAITLGLALFAVPTALAQRGPGAGQGAGGGACLQQPADAPLVCPQSGAVAPAPQRARAGRGQGAGQQAKAGRGRAQGARGCCGAGACGQGRARGSGNGNGRANGNGRGLGRGAGAGRGLAQPGAPAALPSAPPAAAAAPDYLTRLQLTLEKELYAHEYYVAASQALPGVPRFGNLANAESNHARAVANMIGMLGGTAVRRQPTPVVPPTSVAEADAVCRDIELLVIDVYDGLMADCPDVALMPILRSIQRANYNHLAAVGG